jgi:hypothetical protein
MSAAGEVAAGAEEEAAEVGAALARAMYWGRYYRLRRMRLETAQGQLMKLMQSFLTT